MMISVKFQVNTGFLDLLKKLYLGKKAFSCLLLISDNIFNYSPCTLYNVFLSNEYCVCLLNLVFFGLEKTSAKNKKIPLSLLKVQTEIILIKFLGLLPSPSLQFSKILYWLEFCSEWLLTFYTAMPFLLINQTCILDFPIKIHLIYLC